MKHTTRSIQTIRSTLIAGAVALASIAPLHAQMLGGAIGGGLAGRITPPTPPTLPNVGQVGNRAHDMGGRGLDRASTEVRSRASHLSQHASSTASGAMQHADSALANAESHTTGGASAAGTAGTAANQDIAMAKGSAETSAPVNDSASAIDDAAKQTATRTMQRTGEAGTTARHRMREQVQNRLEYASSQAAQNGRQGLQRAAGAVDGASGSGVAGGSANGQTQASGGTNDGGEGSARMDGQAHASTGEADASASGQVDASASGH